MASSNQITICVHVDDLLMICIDRKVTNSEIEKLEEIFGSLSVSYGKMQNYLGMVFDFTTEGTVAIEMKNYIEDLLEHTETKTSAPTPAEMKLFDVNCKNELLSDVERAKFHTVVAKLLYLAKRARPDILLATSYLTTRVTRATEGDLEKLSMCLEYLKGSKDITLRLNGRDYDTVTVYVDASYGTLADRKPHTGTVLNSGRAFICEYSRKQRINTKSSCEAEPDGVSDGVNPAIGVMNFMINQGYEARPVTLMQDNKSTIKMIESGKSNSERSRHIDIRFYFVNDRVKNGDVRVEYLRTEDDSRYVYETNPRTDIKIFGRQVDGGQVKCRD